MKKIIENLNGIIESISKVDIKNKQNLALIYQNVDDFMAHKSGNKNHIEAMQLSSHVKDDIELLIFDDTKNPARCLENILKSLNELKEVLGSKKKANPEKFGVSDKIFEAQKKEVETKEKKSNSSSSNGADLKKIDKENGAICSDTLDTLDTSDISDSSDASEICLFDVMELDDPDTGDPFIYKPFLVIKGLMKKLQEDDELIKEFISSSNEHLAEAEQNLLKLEKNALDEDALSALFRIFHSLKGMASFLQLNDITGLSHEAESLFQGAREGDYNLQGNAVELSFITVDTLSKLVSAFQVAYKNKIDPPVNNDVLNIMAALRLARINQGRILEDKVELLRTFLEREANVDLKNYSEEQSSSDDESEESKAGIKTPGLKNSVQKLENALKTSAVDTVKVDATKLDSLIDTIGELVIVEAMVTHSQELQDNCSDEDIKNLAQMSKICRELQELSMSMRMVPLKSLFQKMARVARDASKRLKKKIQFHISGEQTELDRVLMEKLADPLVHMIRNAVDHGIESNPKARKKAGKSECGNITLNAYYKGGSIIIELIDDGKGLDKDVLVQKAISQGMDLNPESMTDEEIFELIFAAGFSTAKSVSSMSGRGVGMDVVRRNISSLRGRIEVNSTLGEGSTFRMILPLTLAIIDGMVNKIGNSDYIIPTLSILETLNPAEVKLLNSGGRGGGKVFKLRDRLIPIMNIKNFYGITDAFEGESQPSIIVLQDMNRVAAIEVDQLVGQQQIVIKSLGKALGDVEGISGAAIMSDGTVGMIIDVPTILRKVHSRIESLIKS